MPPSSVDVGMATELNTIHQLVSSLNTVSRVSPLLFCAKWLQNVWMKKHTNPWQQRRNSSTTAAQDALYLSFLRPRVP
eukprot:6476162-Amphidinium_carterae.1